MSDMRIQYNEEMVGAGHPTKFDTLNRLALVEADQDGHGLTRYLKAQSADPATGQSEGALYAKTVGGHLELHYRAEGEGAVAQVTSAGRVNVAGPAIPLEDLWMDPDTPGVNVALGATAGRKVMAVQLDDGATQGFLGLATLPDRTRDYQLVIECAQDTALTGKYVALKVEMLATQAGEDPAANSADVSASQAVACRADTGLLIVEDPAFKIASASLHTDHQQVRVGVFRLGGSSSPTDDHTGHTNVFRCYFKAV